MRGCSWYVACCYVSYSRVVGATITDDVTPSTDASSEDEDIEAMQTTLLQRVSRKLEATSAEVAQSSTGDKIRMLQFNVWGDATFCKLPPSGCMDQVVDVIIASEADVVTLSEVREKENPEFMKQMLISLRNKGHLFFGEHPAGDVALISRWPITKTHIVTNHFNKNTSIEDAGSIVAYFLTSPAGRELMVVSAHLDYQSYALYLPRGYMPGGSFAPYAPYAPHTDVAEIDGVERASRRIEEIDAFVEYTSAFDMPVILGGDFNTGSHLDWTEATRAQFDHHDVVYEWPTSRALDAAGFVDAWRELYPDPVTHPGVTWPSASLTGNSTSWAKLADERDRLDYILYKSGGTSKLQASFASLVGSRSYYVQDQLANDTSNSPYALVDIAWPSDHKALLVDFVLNSRVSAKSNASVLDLDKGR